MLAHLDRHLGVCGKSPQGDQQRHLSINSLADPDQSRSVGMKESQDPAKCHIWNSLATSRLTTVGAVDTFWASFAELSGGKIRHHLRGDPPDRLRGRISRRAPRLLDRKADEHATEPRLQPLRGAASRHQHHSDDARRDGSVDGRPGGIAGSHCRRPIARVADPGIEPSLDQSVSSRRFTLQGGRAAQRPHLEPGPW